MNKNLGSAPVPLESIINHVALPPRLPGKAEYKIEQIEDALTNRLLDASHTLKQCMHFESSHQWDRVRKILQICKVVNAGGKLNKTSLSTEFRALEQKDLLILHVVEQNAGLLIRRHNDAQGEIVIFEAFEVSPLSEKVLAAENALQRDFPGCAVTIPYSEFVKASFQDHLAAFLEQASTESIKRFAAHASKAGSFAYESRDTVDPSLITQMLMTLLEVNGHRIFPPLLRKRVRDDVCWTEGAEKPWRRSGYWLLLRVGLERHLCTLHGGEAGRVYYKFFFCLVHARLIKDILEHLNPSPELFELLAFLNAKLTRRLVKLEVNKDRASPIVRSIYNTMFGTLGQDFQKTTSRASEHIKSVWEGFKNTIKRPIRYMPRNADKGEMVLTLANSGPYLKKVLSWHQHMERGPQSSAPFQMFHLPMEFDHFKPFADRYFSLLKLETDIKESCLATPHLITSQEKCIELATKIDTYLTTVADAYDSNPEQKSIMILSVMELWVSMDQCVTELFSVLLDYSPGFLPGILDVLQLPHFTDMCRLQGIQEYLSSRSEKCKYPWRTIFDDPVKGCFAERYFDESSDSQRLQALYRSIETSAEVLRRRKEEEWQRLSSDFERLEKNIAESTCLYTTEYNQVVHDDRACTKCYFRRKAGRMRIRLHEHPLPANPVQAKAVVFELGCPKSFTAYRDVTWRILGTLACPKQMESAEPWLVLCDYSELKAFMKSRMGRVTLASTSKSFLKTHYRGVHLPVSLNQVCVPNGLKLGYFDTSTQAWPARQTQKPTFSHHCRMTIPANSPFSSLQASDDAVDSAGPSSAEVLASQTRCHPGLNVHEFMAYQSLVSGRSRRWPLMLIELGSSNLNFSTEAITLLMTHLTLQAGPAYKLDPLRTIHRVFRDESFCSRLIEQTGQRLDNISSNWRETNCMEMLLTLILRLCSIGLKPVALAALKLLDKARAVTYKWIGQLRIEIHRSTDASTFRRCSRYAFWAALLCRRTFAVYAESAGAGRADNLNLEPAALACFIECSITLQDNLASEPATLPPLSRNSLVRDLKMVHRMRFILRRSFEASPGSVESAINNVWPQSQGGTSRSYSESRFLELPHEWWIQSTIQAMRQTQQQTIHYHLLEGHLLIDGKPLGKLPAEHRKSVVLEQLFGKQSLLTYPSGLRGMTYMVAFIVRGHEIHIGFRNKSLIVQACFGDAVLELVPYNVFGDASNFDLPSSLVGNGNCVHWLDINNGVMEIRQGPDIWKRKDSNWQLNFNTRIARRNRRVQLVDPQSLLFQRVARIFDRFESRERLTVYQPDRGTLTVELRRLELTFSVNRNKLFECRQLRSEIDPDQDAGTWYGLNSKIVLRDIHNWRQRSIIVPMGPVQYSRNRFHVAVNVINDGNYGRFTINDVLGRLECPTEPRLLYIKAQFHAYTSSVVPDPLTGRTGTEEALHCLKSGYCQPWTPLNPCLLPNLMTIAKLTPKREYYPTDRKSMQQVFWDPDLTTTIQHDQFRSVVKAICEKSQKLSEFDLKKTELSSPELENGSAHLLRRSYGRRLLYQRPVAGFVGAQAVGDLPYEGRDRCQDNQSRRNIFECATLIRNWSSQILTTPKLAGILENWPTIGGYDRPFDKFLLSDRLDVQFALEWGSLINLCRVSGPEERYKLMFLFAVVSFRNDVDMEILRTLIAFTVLESLKALDPPKWPSYTHFRHNHIPSADYLVLLTKSCCVPYAGDERNTLQFNLSFKLRRKLEATQMAHEQQTESDCRVLAEFLLKQWPCQEPNLLGFSPALLVDVPRAMEIIRPEWLRLFQNMELSHYIELVQHILDRHSIKTRIEPPKLGIEPKELLPTGCRGDNLPALSPSLLRKAGPIVSREPFQNAASRVTGSNYENSLYTLQKENVLINLPKPVIHIVSSALFSPEIKELESIVNGITNAQSTVHQQYGRDMMKSLDALKIVKSAPKQDVESIPAEMLSSKISRARQVVDEQFNQICVAFERNDSRVRWLKDGSLWPCITPVTLLEQLRSTSTSKFGDGMKESLIAYALSITTLQRLLRIEHANLKSNDQKFNNEKLNIQNPDDQKLLEEQKNAGHGNWQPLNSPDWLLLEIDANILIRHDQVEVAHATISPASGSNSVLQMNMGQGKTSCIMPMVAAVLADTEKLLRVVVPNPLLLQTAQVLQARLGGLLGREVTHVPFSRKTPTNAETIKLYFDIHQEVMATSGVMVALPEHILSFMLSGLQRLSDSRMSEAADMVYIQNWIQEKCRDILDECDYTLAVRTQLIYPSGSQTTVDGHPHRWETAEALLQLVEGHLWNLQRDFPQSIEVVQRPQGGFPMVFFLRKDVEDALINRLVKDVSRGQTSIVPTRECSHSDRIAIKAFISEENVRSAVTERIRQIFPDKPDVRGNIYQLRGLLTHRILLLTLKKRWNVQYGLHPNRDPIAVPFHAKGVPSSQSEFGHSDVAILLTCLAFYFGGLDLAQLRQSLEHVVKSDDPSSEYDRWTHSSKTLPESLHEWNVINVDDEAQLLEIWQHFRYKAVVIDYFLNHFVFPKHAKQFRMKLQASGWDIPLFSPGSQSLTGQGTAAKISKPLTTGFSGTNDNRTMLPLTIKQEDLRGLSHTNTEVLTYLLQPRSRRYKLALDPQGKHFSEVSLLKILKEMGIRMLIDAGAQILEMDNISLVKAWLKEDHEAAAAVYFNTENKPFVLYRHGSQIPLSATPFAEDLGECLVYLDDAHTRGTDLKMPANATGALTLGLGQTKDQTVQAAMRLRQLATSQSVVFFAPPEVNQSILDLRNKRFYEPIDSYDVICWLLEQTCSGIEQIQPLYFSHGTDFCRRTQAALDNPDFLVDANQRNAYLNALRQTEHQTLEQLYKPRLKTKPAKGSGIFTAEINGFMKHLNTQRRGFRDLGNAVHASALQEVEQEREVAFEVEAVREVQKPVHYSPMVFPGLHKDIVRFVETGRLAAGSAGYEHAFVALRRTALGLKYGIRSEATASNLFVSKEFGRTVKTPLGLPNDNFVRPVNWILWSFTTETALVIVPEEAELVIPLILELKCSPTHLLTYAAPVTRKMLHFNNFKYYALPDVPLGWTPPTRLTIELGIISGRLYFEFEEFSDLREYLGFREDDPKPPEIAEDIVQSIEPGAGRAADDTADEEDINTSARQAHSFTAKPLAFLQEWLAIRRKGQDFKHTPMGYVCQDKLLTADHPFYTRAENEVAPKTDGAGRGNERWREGKVGVGAGDDAVSDMDIDEDDGYFDEVGDDTVMFDESEESSSSDNVSMGLGSDSDE